MNSFKLHITPVRQR